MGKFAVGDKFNIIFKNSGAKMVFLTMHELFPRGDWSPKFPELAAKGLADWWDKQYSSLSKTMPKGERDKAKLHRNAIFESLNKISNELAPKGAPMRDEAIKLSAAFNQLVKGVVEGLPIGIEKTNFETASASLLLRLSGAIEAQERGERPEGVEANVKLAEEAQRLAEIAGVPPDALKIRKGEGAREYLKDVTAALRGGNPSAGMQLTAEIMTILEQEKPSDKVGAYYLEHLASKLEQVRGLLLKEAEGPQRPDGDLAMHAILITEAMTPEYTREKAGGQPRPRILPRPPIPPQLQRELQREMSKRAEEVHDRAKEEVSRERRGVERKKEERI
jgi:hypothetical protein